MVLISGFRRQMCALGLLLVVYFMSLTATATNSTTVITAPFIKPKTTAHVTPSKTTAAAHISPTKSTSTASTTTPTPTKAPAVQTTPAPTESGRKFDAASFVGGIILGIVITAILILIFKWWQSKNKSYHSL